MKTLNASEVEIEFLSTELDMAFSLLQRAQSEAAISPTDCASALASAGASLGTVRRLEGHIEDGRAWKVVHARANKLNSDLAAFSG